MFCQMIVPDIFGRKCQWLSETSSGRQKSPSKCWECLVIRGKHINKGSVKGGDLSAVLKWAKGWGETTVFDEIYALLWDFVWDLTELQMKPFFLPPDFPSSLSPLGWIMSLASHLFMMSISFSFCYGGLVRPVPKLSALSNIFVLCEQVD